MSDSRPLGVPFVRLLTSHTVSELGRGSYLIAVPLLASSLTSDARVIAALAVASSVPALVLALPIGAMVDRAHRARLMVGSDLLCCLVLAVITAATLTGWLTLWMLIGAAAVLGTAQLIVSTASFALVPSVVDRSDLTRANGYLTIGGETAGGVVGPPVGGLMFAISPFLSALLTAITFLLSAAVLAPLAGRPTLAADDERRDVQDATSKRQELVAGLTFISRHRAIAATTLLSAAFGLFAWMPEATLVLFARETLDLSPLGFGLLLAVTPVGAVLGGLTLRPLTRRIGTARLIILTHLLYGLLLVPVGLTTNPWVVGGVFLASGIPLIVSDAAVRTLQQTLTPDHLLGRVGAVNRLAGGVSAPLGLAAGGFLAHDVGYPAVWIIAGLACTLITLLLARPTLSAHVDIRRPPVRQAEVRHLH